MLATLLTACAVGEIGSPPGAGQPPPETPEPQAGAPSGECLAALGRPQAAKKCQGQEALLAVADSRMKMHDLITEQRAKCAAIEEAMAAHACYQGLEARLHEEEFDELQAAGWLEPREEESSQ
jgi:hypothetical protein